MQLCLPGMALDPDGSACTCLRGLPGGLQSEVSVSDSEAPMYWKGGRRAKLKL